MSQTSHDWDCCNFGVTISPKGDIPFWRRVLEVTQMEFLNDFNGKGMLHCHVSSYHTDSYGFSHKLVISLGISTTGRFSFQTLSQPHWSWEHEHVLNLSRSPQVLSLGYNVLTQHGMALTWDIIWYNGWYNQLIISADMLWGYVMWCRKCDENSKRLSCGWKMGS